jgi:hypothetical protein
MESGELGKEDKLKFVGEEDNDDNTTPEMDLAAAVVIGLFSLIGLYLAIDLEVPDTLFTAPGLFPVFAATGLLVMSVGLAVKALKGGAKTDLSIPVQMLYQFFRNEENARCGQLIAIVGAYILAVDWFGFDIRIPTGFIDIRFSSYELFSFITLTWIFRLFWKETWLKCLMISAVWSITLATVFRFGFRILLPGSG